MLPVGGHDLHLGVCLASYYAVIKSELLRNRNMRGML